MTREAGVILPAALDWRRGLAEGATFHERAHSRTREA